MQFAIWNSKAKSTFKSNASVVKNCWTTFSARLSLSNHKIFVISWFANYFPVVSMVVCLTLNSLGHHYHDQDNMTWPTETINVLWSTSSSLQHTVHRFVVNYLCHNNLQWLVLSTRRRRVIISRRRWALSYNNWLSHKISFVSQVWTAKSLNAISCVHQLCTDSTTTTTNILNH